MVKYTAIGLMSGTSLDGMDISCCNYTKNNGKWQFEFLKGKTVPYSNEWKRKLSNAENNSALEFSLLHTEYGHFAGKHIKHFINENKINADIIASHGHTVFHQPEKKLTVQIGSGAAIAAECLLPVVCDFRTVDIALNGQGAPLVPAGESYLFPNYPYCLNIGGFANITITKDDHKIAFDICPANIVLNYLVKLLNPSFEYDPEGQLAAEGKINRGLLKKLNNLDFYKASFPKSLGKEWVLKHIHPLLNNISPEDLLRTFTEHIAIQITLVIKKEKNAAVLITGGGVFNAFLISRIKALMPHPVIIPAKEIIVFKEAIIFGFLGVLRMEKTTNCLKSVTGADFDNIGGAVYCPIQ